MMNSIAGNRPVLHPRTFPPSTRVHRRDSLLHEVPTGLGPTGGSLDVGDRPTFHPSTPAQRAPGDNIEESTALIKARQWTVLNNKKEDIYNKKQAKV
jgi:hypothetical protein